MRAALLAAGDSEIELLEPSARRVRVARFLAKRGEGLHHLCFRTAGRGSGISSALAVPERPAARRRAARGARRAASRSSIRSACHGVLVELATPRPERLAAESPVRFKRLVIGCPSPQDTATTYQGLFGLPEVEVNGGPRAMLGWSGGGTLLMVPAGEVGGMEGMVALSMVAPDMPPLIERLERAQAALLLGAGELTVEPASSHGVHLHISRYHFP